MIAGSALSPWELWLVTALAVVEVPHLVGVKRNRFAAVHANGQKSIIADLFDRAEVAIGNAKLISARSVGGGPRQRTLAQSRDRADARDGDRGTSCFWRR
jgi:hypothetical protein